MHDGTTGRSKVSGAVTSYKPPCGQCVDQWCVVGVVHLSLSLSLSLSPSRALSLSLWRCSLYISLYIYLSISIPISRGNRGALNCVKKRQSASHDIMIAKWSPWVWNAPCVDVMTVLRHFSWINVVYSIKRQSFTSPVLSCLCVTGFIGVENTHIYIYICTLVKSTSCWRVTYTGAYTRIHTQTDKHIHTHNFTTHV